MKYLKPLLLCIGLLFFFQCQKDDSGPTKSTQSISGKLAIDYMELLRDYTKLTPGFSPPVAARAFGYAGLTLYEAVVHGMPEYQSMVGQLNELNELPMPVADTYHWGQVANAAMAEVARLYYPSAPPSLKPRLVLMEASYKTDFLNETNESVLERSTLYGQQLANAIFEYSKNDGGHEGFNKNFPGFPNLPVGPGYWVSTSAANPTPLQPYWGNNRTFVKDITMHTQPVKPPDYSTEKTSPFYIQALEVYNVTKNLDQEQAIIAKYWSDDPGNAGTPPGHSISIASQVLGLENADLAVAAETYAKLGIAISDAFVSCWKCKYTFNLVRPVTYINKNIDANWTTLLATPPFPEYTSGHSVQSGATARVLSVIFGTNYAFVDHTHELRTDIPGAPRSFRSFDHAAQEAAISRLYGGIHFRDAIDLGVLQGNKVGDAVNALAFKK